MSIFISIAKQFDKVVKRCKTECMFPSKTRLWVSALPTVGDINTEYYFERKIYSYDQVTGYSEIFEYTKAAPTDILLYTSTYIEFEQILEQFKDKSSKFPLIFINSNKVDYKSVNGGFVDVTLGQVIIATNSIPEWTYDIRDFQNFEPILRPLSQIFIDSLVRFGFIKPTADIQWKEWHFFGRSGEYGSTGNLFSDFVDAIEIKNLKIRIQINNCN